MVLRAKKAVCKHVRHLPTKLHKQKSKHECSDHFSTQGKKRERKSKIILDNSQSTHVHDLFPSYSTPHPSNHACRYKLENLEFYSEEASTSLMLGECQPIPSSSGKTFLSWSKFGIQYPHAQGMKVTEWFDDYGNDASHMLWSQ